MTKKFSSLLAIGLTSLASMATSMAATVLVTDGDANNYGNFDGFLIDFDATTGLAADYTPDLIAGTEYLVNSVSLFERNSKNADYYLGVYTGLSGNTLSGFQGASTNTVNFSLVTDQKVTWNFNGIKVVPETNPGVGGDIRYFILQTVNTALTTVVNQGNDDTQVKRIDAENGSFANHFAAVYDVDQGIRTTRVPEYEAVLTAVPEPSTFGLAALGFAILAGRRRRSL
jgi:hypothetical protein